VPDGTEMALPPADPNAPGLSSQATISSDNVPERRLVGRVVNLSAPSADAPPLAPDEPAATATNGPASPPPLLGIFSGKPMPDWPVRPSIFATDDRRPPEDDKLFQRWMRWVDG